MKELSLKFIVAISFCIVALFSQSTEAHASTSSVFTPSRTIGVAPLSVFFDAASTTNVAVTNNPFHELDYAWNFGDIGAGVWTYGSASTSKNIAYGPETAHVFETPGTYTVTLSVYDGTETVSTTSVIEVQNPDDIFPTTSTICFSTSGTFTGGCPSGATQVSTTSFSGAIRNYATAGKRLLFRKGETFSNTQENIAFTGTLGIISSYGTGAKPIVVNNLDWMSSADIFRISGTVSDWRLVGIEFDLNMGSTSRLMLMVGADDVTKILLLNNTIYDGYDGITQNGGGVSAYDQIAFVGNEFSNLTTYSDPNLNGTAVYAYGSRMSYMGNSVDGTKSHNVRFPSIQNGVISNNYFSKNSVTNPRSNRVSANLKLPGPDWGTDPDMYTQFLILSDNKFESDSGNFMVELRPQSNHNDERLRNVIVERNFFHPLPNYAMPVVGVSGSNITLRNNVGNFSEESSTYGFGVGRAGTCSPTCEPDPEHIFIYNNTFYTTQNNTDGTLRFIQLESTVSAVYPAIVKNNLVYAPNETGVYVVDDLAVGSIKSNNTTNPQAIDELLYDPLFQNTTGTLSAMTDFKFLTGSYAKDAGIAVPVYRDFIGTLRPQNAPLYDIGAFEFESPDTTAPILSESTPIPTGTDTTPAYTFSTTESGTITYGGSCTSSDTTANYGTNTITLNTLSTGTYSDCTITVTDSSDNVSDPLTISSFTITAPSSGGGGGGGGSSSSKKKTTTTTTATTTTPVTTSSDPVIQRLLTLLATLRAQLATLLAQKQGTTPVSTITRDLELGMEGEDVRTLQKYLNTHGYTITTTGPGSPNNETTRFGPATHSAVIRFQNAHRTELGIQNGTGYVGEKTRRVMGW